MFLQVCIIENYCACAVVNFQILVYWMFTHFFKTPLCTISNSLQNFGLKSCLFLIIETQRPVGILYVFTMLCFSPQQISATVL